MQEESQENKVLITTEDVKNVRDFFTHFNVPMPDYLDSHLDDIEKSSELDLGHQKKLKTLIARAILESEHEIFQDDLFVEVKPNCEKEWFDAQFQEDFEGAMEDGD